MNALPHPWLRRLALAASLVVLPAVPRTALAAEQTAREFLAACDRSDPDCRTEFVAGLQAVYAGHMACPPRIDVNTPISPWLDYMRRRVREKPALAAADKNVLQLTAFEHLWPCPKD
jgi:hypothetical protein